MSKHRFKLWRSSAWNRGYAAAMKDLPENDARRMAWDNFLQQYYYKHQNHHMKKEL